MGAGGSHLTGQEEAPRRCRHGGVVGTGVPPLGISTLTSPPSYPLSSSEISPPALDCLHITFPCSALPPPTQHSLVPGELPPLVVLTLSSSHVL